MHRRHYFRSQAGANPLSSLLRYAEIIAEERLSSGRAQAYENPRLHQANLRIEPGTARLDFGGARFFVNSPLAPFIGRPLEVLHNICDIYFGAVDPCQSQSLIQYFSRRPDERSAAKIFFVSGLFADEHNCGCRRSLTKNGLCSRFPEIASSAPSRCSAQGDERQLSREEIVGRHCLNRYWTCLPTAGFQVAFSHSSLAGSVRPEDSWMARGRRMLPAIGCATTVIDALLANGLTVAEKFDLGLDFGWRSGSPLRSAE